MRFNDFVRKITGRTSIEYFTPGALVKRPNTASVVGTVEGVSNVNGKLRVGVNWSAGAGVTHEDPATLVPAEHSQEFKRGQRVSVDGTVGRISALQVGDLYSVEFNVGGFGHDIPAKRIKRL